MNHHISNENERLGYGGNGPGRERYTLLPVSYKKITGIDFGSFSVFYEHTHKLAMTEEQG